MAPRVPRKKGQPAKSKKQRNYRKEYDNYHANPTQVKRRTARNAARGALIKAGAVRKGEGKDVAHRNGNPSDNKRSNISVQRTSHNRSFARTKTAGKRNRRA